MVVSSNKVIFYISKLWLHLVFLFFYLQQSTQATTGTTPPPRVIDEIATNNSNDNRSATPLFPCDGDPVEALEDQLLSIASIPQNVISLARRAVTSSYQMRQEIQNLRRELRKLQQQHQPESNNGGSESDHNGGSSKATADSTEGCCSQEAEQQKQSSTSSSSSATASPQEASDKEQNGNGCEANSPDSGPERDSDAAVSAAPTATDDVE